MTQMLLFESFAETTAANVAANVGIGTAAGVKVPVISRAGRPATTIVEPPADLAVRVDALGKRCDEGGLNHMGDLARLVLLRYDLVAKRRQQMASRRRAAR